MTPRAIRVVLADDTPEMRLMLEVELSLAGGFEVVAEASDGRQALEQVSAKTPDAVVLDLGMPEMDGLQVISAMKQRWPDIKIVVLSGFGDDVTDLARELGAHAAFRKGEDLIGVVDTLRTLCFHRAEPAERSERVRHP